MPNEKLERRSYTVEEFRAVRADEGPSKLTGYAAVFNSLSEELWGFREKIDPGAFSETIKADDVRALFNHDLNHVLGRNTAGTLRLEEDERGLRIEIDMPDTQTARDLLVSVERGDITQMSFGFKTISDAWEKVDGGDVRTLRKVRLFDVSPVTYPAYTDTSVQVRSQEVYEEAKRSGRITDTQGGGGESEDSQGAERERRNRELELLRRRIV